MEFTQKPKIKNNETNFHVENLKAVRDFSRSLILEMKTLVKSIVLFGSNAKDTSKKDSDIDLMIILDNVTVFVTPELREAYKIIISNLTKEIGDKLHIMTINYSDYFDMIRKGDPLILNILRSGVPIYDTGIIEPMQYLLEIGKIRPTKEAVYNYMARSETLLVETEKHIENAVLDLYYSTIDIIHAVLMTKRMLIVSPKEMPKIFKETFKGKKIAKYSKTIEEIYKIAKEIEHKKYKEFSGTKYDELRKKTEEMISEIKEYINEQLLKKDLFEI